MLLTQNYIQFLINKGKKLTTGSLSPKSQALGWLQVFIQGLMIRKWWSANSNPGFSDST